MKLDYSPRQSGKTTRMIQWLSENPARLLITFSHDEENRLKRAHPTVRNQIVNWESYMRAHGISTFREVAIDNVDIILQQRLRHPLTYISINDNDAEQPSPPVTPES